MTLLSSSYYGKNLKILLDFLLQVTKGNTLASKKKKKERKKEKKGKVDSSLDESKLTSTDSHLNYPMTLWWDELFITNDALLFFYLKTNHSFWKHT